jgi:uncharacterized protein (TIGR01777 family)
MHTVIAGGTGFLGRHLAASLASAGHHVTVLSRHRVPAHAATTDDMTRFVQWSPDGTPGPWTSACSGADVIINLAGESIGSKRWSHQRQALLRESRLGPTRTLVTFIQQSRPRPALFISGSAVGYYGNRGDAPVAEDAPAGHDFLAQLAFEWEQEAAKARSDTTRVVFVRTGLVLDPREGALAKMLPAFRLFLGGPFGSGRQYLSWIHRDDWVLLVRWLIDAPDASGPYNATAPHPVTSAEFARALGRALRRPAVMPVPAFVLKLALGKMAGPLLLNGQRALPARALEGGFRFRFDRIEAALADLLP